MGFLDYLDNYEKQLDATLEESVVEKQPIVKKVVKKAPIKKTKTVLKKKPIVEQQKKIVVQEQFDATSHASEILEGIKDVNVSRSTNQTFHEESLNMDVVADHASAIL